MESVDSGIKEGKMNNQQLGRLGEAVAVKYLEHSGYQILKRNYRTRFGEADIIAAKGKELHFIEVKTRRGNSCGSPAESITPLKKKHMKAAASDFMAMTRGMPGSDRHPQLDAMEIQINHIENI